MQKSAKVLLAIVTVALIAVLGLIAAKSNLDAAPQASPTPEATATPAPTATPEEDEPEATETPAAPAQSGDEMYEGALAGLTEEEIGRLAMAEENAEIDSGAGEGAVD